MFDSCLWMLRCMKSGLIIFGAGGLGKVFLKSRRILASATKLTIKTIEMLMKSTLLL